MNTFSHLRASTSVDALRIDGVEKMRRQRQRCCVGPIRSGYFYMITCELHDELAIGKDKLGGIPLFSDLDECLIQELQRYYAFF